MYQIPNNPVRRTANFLRDGSLIKKRWMKVDVHSPQPPGVLVVSGDENAIAKTVDPDWRNNWKWTLIRSMKSAYFCPMCITSPCPYPRCTGIVTLFPVKTPVFAMRVGPDTMDVISVDSFGNIMDNTFTYMQTPRAESVDGRLLLPKEDMVRVCKTFDFPVRFI